MGLFLLCICLLLSLCACAAENGASAPGKGGAISPALDLLRAKTKLLCAAQKRETYSFSRSDFLSLTGDATEYIVINSLPEREVGSLMLNGAAVLAGQTVPVTSLDHLKFIPNGATAEADRASFTFTAKSPGWENRELQAEIILQDTANFPPVATDLTVETYESVACTATLSATDPNGDGVSFEIVKYPRHGRLYLEENNVCYVPIAGYTGTDAFTYRATDPYGAASSDCEVSVSVRENKAHLFFEDLSGSAVHNAAIYLCSEEIMTYWKDDAGYRFSPEEPVSKIDCLVMMLCLCADEAQIPCASQTEAIDDGVLSERKKGFLQTALQANAVHLENGRFYPQEAVTAADAAYMAVALLGLSEQPAKQEFSDLSATPEWARDALILADAVGLLPVSDGKLHADRELDRACIAELLDRMAKLRKGK